MGMITEIMAKSSCVIMRIKKNKKRDGKENKPSSVALGTILCSIFMRSCPTSQHAHPLVPQFQTAPGVLSYSCTHLVLGHQLAVAGDTS